MICVVWLSLDKSARMQLQKQHVRLIPIEQIRCTDYQNFVKFMDTLLELSKVLEIGHVLEFVVGGLID